MEVSVCNPYHASLSGFKLMQMPDGKSIFKIYYLSIAGRSQPQRYEWQFCSFSPAEFEETFLSHGFEGIGFVTTFPHITKVFRFSPQKETILDVQEFSTRDLSPIKESVKNKWHEFACYAETRLAAEEYHAWAGANTVTDYLAARCTLTDFEVINPAKMRLYWQDYKGG